MFFHKDIPFQPLQGLSRFAAGRHFILIGRLPIQKSPSRRPFLASKGSALYISSHLRRVVSAGSLSLLIKTESVFPLGMARPLHAILYLCGSIEQHFSISPFSLRLIFS